MSVNSFPQDTAIYLSGFVLIIGFLYYRHFNNSSRLPLPPGPPKLPFIGNLLDFPSSLEWETYQAWGKRYDSDVVHVNVFGTSIVILNSLKACSDLMEKRSSTYSSRPKFTLVNKYMGFAWMLVFMPYGPEWKERRRLFQQYFASKAANTTRKIQETRYTHRLLLRLLETPENYGDHISHFVSGILHTATYGTKTKQSNDPYLSIAEEVMVALSDTAVPISGILDSIPWLLPIVSRFVSGSPFNKSSEQWRNMVYQLRDEPVHKTQKLMAEGNALDGFVPSALEDIKLSMDIDAQEALIKDVAGVVFIGGTSTTKAVILTFFLAMISFPEAQLKAQEELDRVIGRERLPELNDGPSLPYISALIKEVQRWNTPGPIGVPHFLEQDDEYQGYLIPGQSIIIGNLWAILNDDKMYPNPRAFMPERFLENGELNPSILDPADVGFGFGRRMCPGSHIALSAIWISVASILATFTISKARDEDGVVIEPSMKYRSGVTFQPEPFKCTITPRHSKVGELIHNYVSNFE